MDRSGRIAVPKAFRDQLSLTPGQDVEMAAINGRLEIEPSYTPARLERRNGRLVVVTDGNGPPLTQEMVRTTLEQVRERR